MWASLAAEWLGVEDISTASSSNRLRLVRRMMDQQSSQPTGQKRQSTAEHTNGYFARFAHGNNWERPAIFDLAAFVGLPDTAVHQNLRLRQHPNVQFVGAIPDAMFGTNVLVEIKVPWQGHTDGDAFFHLSYRTLLQVHIQLECYPECDFALVVFHTREYMHIFKVLRDHPSFHANGGVATVWEACVPEYTKFDNMRKRTETAIQTAVGDTREDGILWDDHKKILAALREYADHAVLKLQVTTFTDGVLSWAVAASEGRTNPTNCTLIDRITTWRVHGLPPLQRFLRVWYTKADRSEFYDVVRDGLDHQPSGGRIEQFWYSYGVAEHAFTPLGFAEWGIRL